MPPLVLAAQQHTSLAVASLALVAQRRGELSAALQITDDAIRRDDRGPGRHGHSHQVLWARGIVLIELDRLDEARSTLQASMRHAEDLGAQLYLPNRQVHLAVERFTPGDWDDSPAQPPARLDLPPDIPQTP